MVNTINSSNNSISFNDVSDKTKTADISDIENWDETLTKAGFDEDHAQLIEDEVRQLIEAGATYEEVEVFLAEKNYDKDGDGVLDSNDKTEETDGTIDLNYLEENLDMTATADTSMWMKKLYDAGISDLPEEDRLALVEYLGSGITNQEAFDLFNKIDEAGNNDDKINAADITKLTDNALSGIIDKLSGGTSGAELSNATLGMAAASEAWGEKWSEASRARNRKQKQLNEENT